MSTDVNILLYGTIFQYVSKYIRNVTVYLHATKAKNKRVALMTLRRLHDTE
jgi:hypothetical protein